eukprot:12247_1
MAEEEKFTMAQEEVTLQLATKDSDPPVDPDTLENKDDDLGINETPVFEKNERTKLEAILDDYFIKNDLLKAENQMDNAVLQDLDVSFNEQSYKEFIEDHMTITGELKKFARLPHDHELWKTIYYQYKKQGRWQQRIKLWNIIQHQTVHLITNVYKFPVDIRNALEHCIFYSDSNPPKATVDRTKPAPFANKMEIGTMNMDCIVAGIKLKKAGYNPIVLNLANQEAPAAAMHHRSEGGTQEENLFKRSTLYLSLWPHRDPNRVHVPAYKYSAAFAKEDSDEELYQNAEERKQKENDKKKKKKAVEGFYPMDNKHGGVYSRNVYVFRGSEQSGYAMLPLNQRCVLGFIAVAAQVHYGGATLSEQEVTAFEHKIRTIYNIALENGHDALVLGAMGCGIFNNPPLEVASIFHRILMDEFKDQFARVTFAILWDHNSRPQLVQSFTKYFPQNDKVFSSL